MSGSGCSVIGGSTSMKALPKRKGNQTVILLQQVGHTASMKALPKRKGNLSVLASVDRTDAGLNESPSKKEGKCHALDRLSR